MNRLIKITLALLVLAALAVWLYAWGEPQSSLGQMYLKSRYDPAEENLQSISDQLKLTNGGYIPSSFDDFLYDKLAKAEKDSEEYKNILGFYANQSVFSRAGENIYESGDRYLGSIIEYGRNSPDKDAQKAFLFLAYGIARKEQAYKPSLSATGSISQRFDFIESGELAKVGIESP